MNGLRSCRLCLYNVPTFVASPPPGLLRLCKLFEDSPSEQRATCDALQLKARQIVGFPTPAVPGVPCRLAASARYIDIQIYTLSSCNNPSLRRLPVFESSRTVLLATSSMDVTASEQAWCLRAVFLSFVRRGGWRKKEGGDLCVTLILGARRDLIRFHLKGQPLESVLALDVDTIRASASRRCLANDIVLRPVGLLAGSPTMEGPERPTASHIRDVKVRSKRPVMAWTVM